MEERPTSFSRSLSFLHRDFEPRSYWWEIVEVMKKLFLVGFAVLIKKDSLYQLTIALVFTLIHMLLMATYMPYRDIDNDYFALACNFGLTTVFFFSHELKVGVLTAAVQDVLSDSMQRRFNFSTAVLSKGLFVAVISALVVMTAAAAQQMLAAARVPTIRVLQTGSGPDLSLDKNQKWHIFLSHIWGTGQDQCAAIKRQLCLLLPGVSVFLDVDDLKDIGALH